MENTTQSQKFAITRTIRSSPDHIYAAFTTAQGWCAWSCETAEADARVGGRLHIYTEGYHAYGQFTSLEPSRVVAFTWNGDREPPTRIFVTLDPLDEATTLTFAVMVLGPAEDAAAFSLTLERIWAHALDNLKAVLEAEPRS